ncbi:MAG: transporter [Alphaproteobacteria bacterium]|nr:MAG: transporter [Alphaproteobacteria bacterium]
MAQAPDISPNGTRPAISPLYLLVTVLFVACLIAANITATKLIEPWGLVMDAGTIVFPVSYILGDVLTEVYGFRAARRVIWLGFLANLLVVAAIAVAGLVPPASFWEGQAAYEQILGFVPRILAASFCAYLVGEFANSIVLAKLKIATQGRHLWLRTIGSTLVGQGLDSLVFVTLAFGGVIPAEAMVAMILTQWLVKSAYEALATPVTYGVVGWLKRREGVDVYDRDTRFNPLALAD